MRETKIFVPMTIIQKLFYYILVLYPGVVLSFILGSYPEIELFKRQFVGEMGLTALTNSNFESMQFSAKVHNIYSFRF